MKYIHYSNICRITHSMASSISMGTLYKHDMASIIEHFWCNLNTGTWTMQAIVTTDCDALIVVL